MGEGEVKVRVRVMTVMMREVLYRHCGEHERAELRDDVVYEVLANG